MSWFDYENFTHCATSPKPWVSGGSEASRHGMYLARTPWGGVRALSLLKVVSLFRFVMPLQRRYTPLWQPCLHPQFAVAAGGALVLSFAGRRCWPPLPAAEAQGVRAAMGDGIPMTGVQILVQPGEVFETLAEWSR